MKDQSLGFNDLDRNEDDHLSANEQTPLRADAFALSDEEKIERIKASVSDILTTLGMDLTDDSIKGTPKSSGKNVCQRDIRRP